MQTRKAVEVAKTPKYEGRIMRFSRTTECYTCRTHTGSGVPMCTSIESVTYVDVSRCGKGVSHPTLTAARQAEAASVRKAALAHKVKVPKADVVVAEEEEKEEEKLMQKAIGHHLCTSAAQRKAPRRRRAKTARSSVLAATILEVLHH